MQKVPQIRSVWRLIGARVLVVEDDFLISMDLKGVLTDAGAEVVGPCRTVIDAVTFVNGGNISAALLDIRLTLESVVPVATRLTDRRIPFVFYTGYLDTGEIREKFPHCKILHKPASPEILVDAIAEVLGRATPPPRYIRRRLMLLVIGLVVIVSLVLCIY
jgi:two-component SAPR family response regulator